MKMFLKLLLKISLALFTLLSVNAHAYSIQSTKLELLNENSERIFFASDYAKTISVAQASNTLTITLKDKFNGKLPAIKKGKFIESINVNNNKIIIQLNIEKAQLRKFITDKGFGVDIIKTAESRPYKPKTELKSKPEPKKDIKKAPPAKPATKKVETKVINKEPEKKVSSENKPKTEVIDKTDQVLKLPTEPKKESEITNSTPEPIPAVPVNEVKQKVTTPNFIKFFQIGTDIELSFEWFSPTGAAVFNNSGNTFIVFDNTDTPPMIPQDSLVDIKMLSGPNYTVYYIPKNDNIKIERNKSLWNITFTKQPIQSDPYNIGDARVTPEFNIAFNIPGIVSQVSFTDPNTDQQYIVSTVSNEVINVEKKYTNIDFELIKTYLGAVIIKKNDKINTKLQKNNLIIESPSFRKNNLSFQTKESYFNFGLWKNNNPDFTKQKEKILFDLTRTETKQKYIQRIRLADFFMQNGMPEEALAVIENAKIYDPFLIKNPEIKIKTALLNFIKGNNVVARNQFNDIDLASIHAKYQNEISMLIAAANLSMNEEYKDRRINYVLNKDFFLSQYPIDLRSRIGIIELTDLLDNEEYDLALDLINALTDDIDKKYLNDLKYLQAKVAINTKETKFAIKLLKELQDQPNDLKNRARAMFELAKLDLESGKVPQAEAFSKMEQAMFIWRNEYSAGEILIEYGELAMKNKLYTKAFRAWQNLVDNYQYMPESIAIASEMSQRFVEIFSQDKIPDGMNEMEYANMFFEFRELTPIGDQGDDIVRKMVNRLVNLDLMDQAQNILNHQIRFRSKGKEKTNLIRQLAYLYLYDNKPDKAIEVLQIPLDEVLSFDENRNFNYLKATAFARNKNFDQAFSMLENDLSTSATGIRVDMFWELRDWAAIKKELNVASEIWSESDSKLTTLQERLIIKLAVAYEMLNDKNAILRLRQQFYMRFASDDNKYLMNYLSEEPIKSDIRMVANTLDSKVYQDFMKSYMNLIKTNYDLSTAFFN